MTIDTSLNITSQCLYNTVICNVSFSRGFLHPGLHALYLDRQVDAGPWTLQAVACDGLLIVHGFRLQYRLNQLRSLPVRYPSCKYQHPVSLLKVNVSPNLHYVFPVEKCYCTGYCFAKLVSE